MYGRDSLSVEGQKQFNYKVDLHHYNNVFLLKCQMTVFFILLR